jgi:hypothetical protein
LLLGSLAGCGYGPTAPFRFNSAQELAHYNAVATHIDMPNVGAAPDDPLMCSQAPDSVGQNGQIQYWDMALEQAMQISLSRSKVLHDLGGTVLNAPANTRTIHGPAIVDTDPRYGVEAALSDFDAVFNSTVDSQHNDRLLNNVFFGGGTRDLRQDLDTFKNEITKETPTGTTFAFRNNTVYDHNNEPGNLFGSAWDTNFEAEVRQHILQGAGTEYNRIAGTHGAPGQYNGVMIARINTDIGLVEFQIGVRDLVSNVENAYWDLYFAYRDLDAKVAARDKALESWRNTHARFLAGRRGGEAEKEAAAREQYFQFQEEVENAWSGRLIDGTQTNNGSSGGTLRGNGGVRVAERRLRLLLGLPASDGRLIRPSDEPSLAKMVFCWEDILPEALTRRDELRRQRWQVKRRELELIASRNFLLPTFDVFGLYRWRGFGHDLISSDTNVNDFESALADLDSGNHQEWELGAEFSMPLGERKGHAAVRNAQLVLSRERAVLEDQERQVVHDLSNAIADLDRAYEVAQTAYNRRMAALAEVAATKAAYEADKAPLDLYLESQRRLADAESRFFAALVDYALSIKNVHFEKGSLLEYNDVFLAESPWPDKAYKDAAKRRVSRWQGGINYTMKPGPVSGGPIEQETGSPRRETAESVPAAESLPPPQPGAAQQAPAQQAPAQQGPAQQGPQQPNSVPPVSPSFPTPPQIPTRTPANTDSSASPLPTPRPTNHAFEPPPAVWQQAEIDALPERRVAESSAPASLSANSPSIMSARPRDFDNLQPVSHRVQESPAIIGVASHDRDMNEAQPAHDGDGKTESASRQSADKAQDTGTALSRASYIQTIPIPWSRKKPEKNPATPKAETAHANPIATTSPVPMAARTEEKSSPDNLNPNPPHRSTESAAAGHVPSSPVREIANEPAAPAQPQRAIPSIHLDPPAQAARPVTMPPAEATGPNGLLNVERMPAVHAQGKSPFDGDAKSLPSNALRPRAIPAGILQASGVVVSGGAIQADAGLPNGQVVHADAPWQPSRVVPAYGLAQPSNVMPACGISQPSATLPAYGIAQALPPVGRIQNLPPLSSSSAGATSIANASSGVTASDWGAGTASDFHPIRDKQRPAIEKLQSLPPIGPIPSASSTSKTARPLPPIGPMQSLPPIGGGDSLASKGTTQSPPRGIFQSLPPRGSATTTQPNSGPQSSLSSGTMRPLPQTGGLQALPPL